MGDWNEISRGRSLMGRAQPLLLAIIAQRRRGKEMQRGPGVIPNGGQGAHGRISGNDGGGFEGTKIIMFFRQK